MLYKNKIKKKKNLKSAGIMTPIDIVVCTTILLIWYKTSKFSMNLNLDLELLIELN